MMNRDDRNTSQETNQDQGSTEAQAESAEQTDGSLDPAQVDLDEADVYAQLEIERRRVAELEDQLLRRAAEFQNYRRRTQEDLAFAAERGRTEVILRMIEVLDDLRRSREAAEQAATREKAGPLYEALKQGVDLVYRKLQDTLAAFGVEEIESVGAPFDERLHEAMMQQEAEGHEPGTVVDEIQKGYALGDRVLRHAQVVVAR